MTAKNQLAPDGARKTCVVLELDDVGRAAALRHIARGQHGATVLPAPQGLFDSWPTRPRLTP